MGYELHSVGPNRRITVHLSTQEHDKAVAAAEAEKIARVYAAYIAEARFSLHIAAYDFRLAGAPHKLVTDALEERARAGVDVRIAYHQGRNQRTPEAFAYLGADPAPAMPSDFDANMRAIGVQTRGIEDTAELTPPVVGEPIDPGSHLMHSKYIIRDGTTPAAAVLTGSANFTNDAWSAQENNIIIFEQAPELARFYENDFGEMWQSGQIANSGRDDTGAVTVDGIDVRVAFSPGQGRQIDADITHMIGSAQRRLLVACMVISSGTVLGAIADRTHRVDEFAGIFDETQMRQVLRNWTRWQSQGQQPGETSAAPARARARSATSQGKADLFNAIAPLMHAKHSTPYTPTGIHDYMHDKLAVCDDTVVTGSYNFSTNATRNAENVVMISSPELAEIYATYVRALTRIYPDTGMGSDTHRGGRASTH